MKRSTFIKTSLMTIPMASLSGAAAIAADRPKKGILVKDGENRMQETVKLDSVVSIDFKVLTKDTDGELSVLLSSNNLKATGPPVHIHPDFDETFYVTQGEVKFK